MTHTRAQSALAAVLALVVVLNAASVGIAVPASADSPSLQTQAGQEEPAAGPGDADEAYVTEDGDVVLVYSESDTGSDTATGHVGANLSEGLFHLFLNDTLDEAADTTGNLSLSLTGDQLTGEGDLLTTKPDSVEELSFTASGVTNSQESSASMALDAVLVNTGSGMAQPLDTTTAQESPVSVETSGSVTTSASQFRSEGVVAVSGQQANMVGQDMSAAVTISEDGEDYVVDVSRENRVSQFAAEQWSSEESARETIRAQFAPVAQSLGGEVSVELGSYSFDEETQRLDIEYTVTFAGVDQAVADRLAPMLAEAEQLDLSESEADELADQLASVDLTTVAGSVDVSDGSATVEWDVQIDNYDQLALAVFEIADAVEQPPEMPADSAQADFDSFEQNLEQSRAQFEAQRAANLTQQLTWDVTATAGSERVEVSATAAQETENWAAYVEEIQDVENVSIGGDTEFDVAVETVDGDIQADASFSLSQDGLIDQALQGAQQGSAQAGFGDGTPAEAFQRADFEVAKMDLSADGERVTVEAGASFENATEFREFVGETYGDTGEFERLYAQPEDGGSTTYVRFNNAVDEEPTASEVRALETVSAETTVYLPDEWDETETEFPEMDTEEVRSYLDLDEEDESGISMETIVPVAVGGAVLALAGGAVVGLRRL